MAVHGPLTTWALAMDAAPSAALMVMVGVAVSSGQSPGQLSSFLLHPEASHAASIGRQGRISLRRNILEKYHANRLGQVLPTRTRKENLCGKPAREVC